LKILAGCGLACLLADFTPVCLSRPYLNHHLLISNALFNVTLLIRLVSIILWRVQSEHGAACTCSSTSHGTRRVQFSL
jgi:hypothetical protein